MLLHEIRFYLFAIIFTIILGTFLWLLKKWNIKLSEQTFMNTIGPIMLAGFLAFICSGAMIAVVNISHFVLYETTYGNGNVDPKIVESLREPMYFAIIGIILEVVTGFASLYFLMVKLFKNQEGGQTSQSK